MKYFKYNGNYFQASENDKFPEKSKEVTEKEYVSAIEKLAKEDQKELERKYKVLTKSGLSDEVIEILAPWLFNQVKK